MAEFEHEQVGDASALYFTISGTETLGLELQQSKEPSLEIKNLNY